MKRMIKVFLALTASAVLWAGQANAVLIGIGDVTEGVGTVTIDIVATDLGDDVIVAYNMDILFSGFTGVGGVIFSDALDLLGLPAITGLGGVFGNILEDIAALSWAMSEADYLELAALQQTGDPLVLFTLTFTWDGSSDYGVSFIWDVENGEDVKCAPNEVCFPVSVA